MPDNRDSEKALADIDRRLKALNETATDPKYGEHSAGKGFGVASMMWLAFNIVSDLIAGVVCGLGIGYGLDAWLGTRPAFIAVFLCFGCAAGILNAVRFVQRYNRKQSERLNSKTGETTVKQD